MALSKEEQLQKLEQQEAALKQRKKRLKHEISQKRRKAETQQKIIIGGIVNKALGINLTQEQAEHALNPFLHAHKAEILTLLDTQPATENPEPANATKETDAQAQALAERARAYALHLHRQGADHSHIFTRTLQEAHMANQAEVRPLPEHDVSGIVRSVVEALP